jgi:uncharacterized membrane protein
MQNQKSAIGLDGNITAVLGYIIGIIALILVFIEKDNRFVRFHALQSVLWFAICIVGIIVVAIVGTILALVLSQVSGSLGGIVGLLAMLVYVGLLLAMWGGLIFAAIKAYGGSEFKLPVAGNLAQKWV